MIALALAGLVLSANPSSSPEKSSTSSTSSTSSSTSSTSAAGATSTVTLQEAGSASTPQGRTFGVGLQLGYPTSVTLKYMLRPDQGIVAGVGGFTGFDYTAGALSLHVDYVWHPNLLTQGDQYAVTWYIGAGGNIIVFGIPTTHIPLGFEYNYYPTNIWLGARVPFGVNVALKQLPFEVYAEAVPQLLVFPGIGFGVGAAIGGRAYF